MTALDVVPDPEQEPAPGPLRARLERVANLPSPRRAWAVVRWWATTGVARVGVLFIRAPYLLACELRPILAGAGRILGGWADWMAATEHATLLRTATEHTERGASELLNTVKGRRRLSAGGAVVLAGGTWWSWIAAPVVLVLVGVALVLVADVVGRRTHAPARQLPAPARRILIEGVSLHQITASILERAVTRFGIEFGVERPMTWSPGRQEYELHVTSPEPITREVCADIERHIGAADYAVRALAPADNSASVRRLVIRTGDPLAVPTPAPVLDSLSSSIVEPAMLGQSLTEVPFALPFAGVHHRVVAGTGGGKTKWAMRSTIRALSAKRDVVLGLIDITNGPEGSLWRGVLQLRGFDVEAAERVLDVALGEIDRRSRILSALAEDDDPDNDVDEWHAGLGPALVILVDEFAQLAAFDGKQGRANLLGKAEQVVRTGRKHWVSLVMFTQRTGNDDFGSTTMSSQCAVTVAGPCEAADTVRMFGTERRDQGYTPHLLSPGVEGDPRDAGKVFVSSPAHRTPDVFRYYAPGTTGDVKRLARQRIADGLPTLAGGPVDLDQVDAVTVPGILVDVEASFADAGNPDRMATAELLERVGGELTERELADVLRPYGIRPRDRWRPEGGGNAVRGYVRADLLEALEGLQ